MQKQRSGLVQESKPEKLEPNSQPEPQKTVTHINININFNDSTGKEKLLEQLGVLFSNFDLEKLKQEQISNLIGAKLQSGKNETKQPERMTNKVRIKSKKKIKVRGKKKLQIRSHNFKSQYQIVQMEPKLNGGRIKKSSNINTKLTNSNRKYAIKKKQKIEGKWK